MWRGYGRSCRPLLGIWGVSEMGLVSDFLASYRAADYKRESRALAAYDRWSRQFIQSNGWTVIPADKKPRGIAATVDNAMRSRVERYQIFTSPAESMVAYIGDRAPNGMGIDRQMGRTYPLTVWTGEVIGYATLGTPYYIRGTKVHRVYAWIHDAAGNEHEYTGQ